jgi:opacity protein-like surface antigen
LAVDNHNRKCKIGIRRKIKRWPEMKKLFVAFVVSVLLISTAGAAVIASPPVDHPGKGPPDLTKVVFVHYPKGLEAKGGKPGPPDKPPKDDNGGGGGGKLWYEYSGIHWDSTSADFLYNPAGEPGDYLGAIQLGFDTWTDVEGSSFDFTFDGTTGIGISSLANEADGHNVVGWADLDAEGFSNAIAVTMVWYNSAGIIQEVDMAFSNNPEFTWHQNDDIDELWDIDNYTDAYDVDVQNIATHEAGHWLLLEDMYNKPAGEQTMFGISAEFDLQKRSLESGDIAGIEEIYPAG